MFPIHPEFVLQSGRGLPVVVARKDDRLAFAAGFFDEIDHPTFALGRRFMISAFTA